MRKVVTLATFLIIAPLTLFSLSAGVIFYPYFSSPQSSIHQPDFTNLFRAFQKGGGEVKGIASGDNARIPILQKFFAKYKSVLQPYSSYIVQTADTYGIDYRLIPAISMQESTGCKFIPENSYNCWGWGIYGDKVTRFSSYQEGIDTVSRGLKRNYYDQGLREPHQIMAKYTPPALEKGGSWAIGVNYFFDEIEAGTY